MSAIPGYYFEYLAFSAFWLFVVGLDLVCLWSLRRSRIEAAARVLWVVWIVIAPIIGAISYFILQPAPEERETRTGDSPFHENDARRQRRSENIQR